MRTTLVVLLWLVATAGVVYVANAAVELVDLQVLPGGSRIEVLSLPGSDELTPTTTIGSTTSAPVTSIAPSTTDAPLATQVPATTIPATTIPATTIPATTIPATTIPATTIPATTTAAVDSEKVPATSSAPTTTIPPTTTRPPAPTTTLPVTPATTTVPPVPTLIVVTDAIPEGRIGESYQVVLGASGGIPPYSWTLLSGELPVGFEFSTEGVLSGVPSVMANASLVFEVTDTSDHSAVSPTMVFATTPDRRTVIARGGTIFIDSEGDLVSLFLVSPADGYSAVIVEPGGFRVEVQFVPLQGDATSFVVCEVNEGVVCTTG